MIQRHARQLVVEAIQDSRVALLVGPRQAGKTTLVGQIADHELPMSQVTLDHAGTRRLAQADPIGFIAGLELPAAIDEVHRAPELLLEIKRVVDRDPTPGRFLLTGSARVLSLPKVADALVGRAQSVTLWPLSQAELEGSRRNLVDELFAGSSPAVESAELGQEGWVRRALRGGFAEACARAEGRSRDTWFASYLETLVQRDIRDLAEIRALDEVPALLALVAARAAAPANFANLASELRISEASVRRYLALLEAAFISHRVPAWRRSLGRRATATPKLQLVDSGLAAHLLGIDASRLRGDPALGGNLLESFVRMELVKLASTSDAQPRLHHLRTRTGSEVDAVLERRGGEIVAIEVKASATPSPSDFKGLKELRDTRPDHFRAGIVLHPGSQTLPFGDRLWATPLSALWR